MTLPRYLSKLDMNALTMNPDGSYTFDDGKRKFALNNSAIELAKLCGEGFTINELVELGIKHFSDSGIKQSKHEIVKSLNDLYDKQLIEEQYVSSSKWNAPLLITGCARSGTTALTRALSSHHDICIFNEYQLYANRSDDFLTWQYIKEMRKDNPPPEKISVSTTKLRSKMLEELPLPVSNEATKNWLLDSLVNPVHIYGDKMPYKYLSNMHEIIARYPKVKFLITLRDGRDVVASQIRKYNAAIDNGSTPSHWMKATVKEAEYLWLRSAKKWLNLRSDPPAPCLEIRYEDAVQSPLELACNICDFTGIEYKEQDFNQFKQRYRAVNINSWREEIKDIEEQLSNEFLVALNQLGYK
jgi:hypothetical protein